MGWGLANSTWVVGTHGWWSPNYFSQCMHLVVFYFRSIIMWMITSVSKSGGLSIVLLGQVTNAFFLRIFFVWSKYFPPIFPKVFPDQERPNQILFCRILPWRETKNIALVTDCTLGLDENQRSRHFFFGFVSGGSSAANIASSKTFFNPFWKCKK